MQTSATIIALRGELDLSNVAALRASLGTISGPAVVDLSDVTYLDSTALYELDAFRRRVGSVALVVASPNVRRTLEIVGFQKFFRVVEGRDFL
ncbi:MAG TPA: STAS domain-containing protein [Candidatus Limnocylindrales bacterium]|nr:STAS domain-containing protein [Candidatus Limnocylindrales bacterium]